MHKFKELRVWQQSVEVSAKVYNLTKKFPREELFGLTSQMRRAAISIASNIAEGAGRNSPKEFYNFLGIANGSSSELQTQLIIAKRLGYLTQQEENNINGDLKAIGNMIFKLQKSLSK
ncbi:MAG: four helix bundle protein [Bacteroidota bacterium]